MVKFGLFAVALVAAPTLAFAQYVPYQPRSYGSPTPAPAPSTSYDYRSGNMITTTPSYGGGASIRGYNTQTGSTWNTRVQPNGNATGTDANGNLWTYNRSSGSYMNTDGTVCIGKGPTRVCN